MVLSECFLWVRSHILSRIWISSDGHMGGRQIKSPCYCSHCRFHMCLGYALVYKYPIVECNTGRGFHFRHTATDISSKSDSDANTKRGAPPNQKHRVARALTSSDVK